MDNSKIQPARNAAHSAAGGPTLVGDILSKYKPKEDGKYISQEFQDYAYRLAIDLDDLAHKSLYMRLAKSTPRGLLDAARTFAMDAPNARSKGRIFMWKLRELRQSKVKG